MNPALWFIPWQFSLRQVVPGVIQPLALRTASPLPRHLYHHHSLPTHSSYHLNTWPCHFKLLSCTILDISPTFAIPVIFSFLILSSLVTQIIHRHLLWFIHCPCRPTLVFARVHVRFFIHTLYWHYLLIWQSILHIAPLDCLTRHYIVRLPCFAIRCRTANIASAIPLPGIKPNCASLKPGLHSVRRTYATEMRNRIYASHARRGVYTPRVDLGAYTQTSTQYRLRTISGRWIYFICRVKPCVNA